MTQQRAEPEGALADLKVLDLSGPIGVYCAKLMADLGADVVRVEPPGGDPMRKLGPFYNDDGKPEHSLYWWHFNTSRRGITLDIEKPDGREVFKRLAKWADALIETFEPGTLDKLGLGWDALHALNPRLIVSSITPFGQTGPYAHFKGTDIVGQAMSGVMTSVGFPDAPPYLIATEMAYFSAGVLAANGTMLAIFHRDLTGQGQHVDTSMQQAMSLGGSVPLYDMLGQVIRRGEMWQRGRGAIRSVFRCKDGYVFFVIVVGTSMEAVRDLLVDEELGEEFDPEWLDVDALRQNPPESRRFEELISRFFARYTKWEVLEKCFNRKDVVFAVPTDTPKDVVESPHLKAKGFIHELEHAELGKTIRYPGAPYKLPESPWRISRRAPLVGEHNQEVYEDVLGLNESEIARLRERGVI